MVAENRPQPANDAVQAHAEVNDSIGPQPRDELFACHQLTRVRQQLFQDLRLLGPQLDSRPGIQEFACLRAQRPGVEADFGRWIHPTSC